MPAELRVETSETRRQSRRVLVVDDEPDIRVFLSEALLDAGHLVATACNGQAALAYLERLERDRAPWPDVLVVDMKMPVMDGPALAAAYQRRPEPHAPIVVITASKVLAESAAALEPAHIVHKPFDVAELLSLIEGMPPRATAA